MSLSTVLYTCNTSGFIDAKFAGRWGMVGIDWSNAKRRWTRATPFSCETELVEQARRIKAANRNTRVMVHRNLAKALPWFVSISSKLADPRFDGFFLGFS